MATYPRHALYFVDPCIGVVFRKVSSRHIVGSNVLRVCHGARDERQDQCRTKLCRPVSRLLPHRTSPFSLLRLVRGNYAFSGIGHGFTFQISAAYSAMVRSLENFPEPATFRMALCAHPCGSLYSSQSRRSA